MIKIQRHAVSGDRLIGNSKLHLGTLNMGKQKRMDGWTVIGPAVFIIQHLPFFYCTFIFVIANSYMFLGNSC